MKNFVVIYHAPDDALERMQNTPPEEAKKGMELWMQWAQKCGEHLIDLGAPLTNGVMVDQDGGNARSRRQVCGYSILQADNMDHVMELLRGHPHLSGWDAACEIEVHETMPLPQ